MRRLLCLLCVFVTWLAASAAHAGWGIEASIGKGAKLSPSPVSAEQVNLMIAPGFGIPFFRFELGLAGDLPDVKNSKFDLEIRPMVVVAPPVLPLYGRLVVAVANLLNDETEIAFGGAGGLKFGLGPLGVFAEAGLLPRSRMSRLSWVIEGRVGASFGF